MGRKKGSKNKKGSTNKRGASKKSKQKKSVSIDLIGGMLIVAAIAIYIFMAFNNSGTFGLEINHILTGIFGIAKFGIPVILLYLGISFIVVDEINVPEKIYEGLFLLVVVSATLYTFTSTKYIDGSTTKYIQETYQGAINGANIGGVVGGLISSFLNAAIGILATRLILVTATFLTVIFILNITLKELIFSLAGFVSCIVTKISEYMKGHMEVAKEEKETKDVVLAAVNKDKKQSLKEEKLAEKGVSLEELEDNLQVVQRAEEEQLAFNLDKLDKKLMDEQEKAKVQRDEFFKKQVETKEDKNVKEVLQLEHIAHIKEQEYEFPPLNLLNENPNKNQTVDKKAIQAVALKLQKTLASFGVQAKVTNITRGPTVTRYELTPSIGVRVNKIVNLSDDIALSLAAKSIRIEAPIPGKAAVGIEVPNEKNEMVYLKEVLEAKSFKEHKSKLAFALGKDAAGDLVTGDISKFPHVLIAGATGSGKSVCINTLITSILYKSKPSEVKLMLIDPKMVELSGYNGIPHLLIPVVTDPKKAAGALNWAVQEMVNRYTLFASKGTKDIKGYNAEIEKENSERLKAGEEEVGAKLPQIVIIIDELADLMMVAPNDVEDAICRLAQMARAAGMHLVIATQRPSVDVITGIIKANIPSRIAFTVSSQIDSRTVLDACGAEKLLGKGDMLYFPVGETKPLRIQGCFVSEQEIDAIVSRIKSTCEATYSDEIIQKIEKANSPDKNSPSEEGKEKEADELLTDAIDLIVSMGSASASMLQRRFKIGYSRAGRMIDQIEARGIISGHEGSKPRQVLISKEEWQELKMYEDGPVNPENANV
ncbi:MAG: DNA translocase FtsK 4TM domain-containing protein [Clostridia bacterium]